jgi:hypothetical protein
VALAVSVRMGGRQQGGYAILAEEDVVRSEWARPPVHARRGRNHRAFVVFVSRFVRNNNDWDYKG